MQSQAVVMAFRARISSIVLFLFIFLSLVSSQCGTRNVHLSKLPDAFLNGEYIYHGQYGGKPTYFHNGNYNLYWYGGGKFWELYDVRVNHDTNGIYARCYQSTLTSCTAGRWYVYKGGYYDGDAKIVCATDKPTQRPTTDPSRNPTANPTNNPSQNPSSNPTCNPSSNPTSDPSSNPTPNPSSNPTVYPTLNPTSMSTNEPSKQPSINPKSASVAHIHTTENVAEDKTMNENAKDDASDAMPIMITIAAIVILYFCLTSCCVLMFVSRRRKNQKSQKNAIIFEMDKLQLRPKSEKSSLDEKLQVNSWLNDIDLESYTQSFIGNGYDSMKAISLIECREELSKIGIFDFEHQNIILESTRILRGESGMTPQTPQLAQYTISMSSEMSEFSAFAANEGKELLTTQGLTMGSAEI